MDKTKGYSDCCSSGTGTNLSMYKSDYRDFTYLTELYKVIFDIVKKLVQKKTIETR